MGHLTANSMPLIVIVAVSNRVEPQHKRTFLKDRSFGT